MRYYPASTRIAVATLYLRMRRARRHESSHRNQFGPEHVATLCAVAAHAEAWNALQSVLQAIAAQPIPAADELRDIATALEDGVGSDIWYDAHEFDGEEDEAAENTIEETQNAMSSAATFLRKLAGTIPAA